jgi:hypothetical protein
MEIDILRIATPVGTFLWLVFGKDIKKYMAKHARRVAARLPWNKIKAQELQDAESLRLLEVAKSIELGKRIAIDRLIGQVGARFLFNRVTITCYDYFSEPLTIADFENGYLTITNEWTDDNTKPIMQEFQKVSCDIYAAGIQRLEEDLNGWIQVPLPGGMTDKINRLQKTYGVMKSYRFKLNDKVINGSMTLSYTHTVPDEDLTAEEIEEIKIVAMKVYNIKKKRYGTI